MSEQSEPEIPTEYTLVMTPEEYAILQRLMVMQRNQSQGHMHDFLRAKNFERAAAAQEIYDFTMTYHTKVVQR